MITTIVILLAFTGFGQVYGQDTTSTNNNEQGAVQENKDNTVDDSSGELKEGIISTEDQAQEGGNPTQEQTDQVTQDEATPTNERGEAVPVEDKIGPNGEQLFMENGNYFYLNENGAKIEIKKSDVRDKSQ